MNDIPYSAKDVFELENNPVWRNIAMRIHAQMQLAQGKRDAESVSRDDERRFLGQQEALRYVASMPAQFKEVFK